MTKKELKRLSKIILLFICCAFIGAFLLPFADRFIHLATALSWIVIGFFFSIGLYVGFLLFSLFSDLVRWATEK